MHQLDRFQRFCSGFLGLELEPFQIKIAREMFSDRREALILLPRGNGKSTLLAAIALWHLLSASDPRIAIGAASREQAATLFDSARTMAKLFLNPANVKTSPTAYNLPNGAGLLVSRWRCLAPRSGANQTLR